MKALYKRYDRLKSQTSDFCAAGLRAGWKARGGRWGVGIIRSSCPLAMLLGWGWGLRFHDNLTNGAGRARMKGQGQGQLHGHGTHAGDGGRWGGVLCSEGPRT